MRLPSSVRCIGYARVSTERQAGEVQTSIADQERAILSHAERLGVQVGAWFRDEGASGASVEARPEFRAMLEACEASPRPPREPGLILVLNDSRFGRFPDPDEAAALRFRFKQLGWIVRFCEGDDVEDVTFRSIIRSLGSAQASEYRRNIQRNARRGARGAAEQGFWTREAPFGYRRKVVYPPGAERVLEIGQLKAPNEKVKLTPHEEEAAVVRWIFESYASGEYSLGRLAEALLARVPGRRWSRTVVQHLLKNPVYMGDVVGGRRPADRSERLITPVRSEAEWYGCRDAHPPVVSRDLFARVEDRLEKNARRGPAARAHYLMSGLLACPYCGEAYIGGGVGNKTVRGERRNFYKDRGGMTKVCPGRIGTVMRHIIDDAVVGTLAKTISSPTVRRHIEAEIDRQLDALAGSSGESVASLRAAERRLNDRRDRIVGAIADGVLMDEEAEAQLRRIRAELSEIETRIHEVRFGDRRAEMVRQERDRIVEAAVNFHELAERLRGPALRELVEPWLAGATFDKATRELVLRIRRTPALLPANLPGPASRKQTLIRRISLVQPGRDHLVAVRLDEIARARSAGGRP